MDSRSKAGARSPVAPVHGTKKLSPKNAVNLPRRSSTGGSPKVDSSAQAVSDSSAEKILCDILFGAKASVIKGCAAKESVYALERILPFITQRSRETVEQEVSKIIVKLVELRGPSPHHRMVAYASVGEQILAEINSMIYNTDSLKLKDLQQQYDQLKYEKDQLHTEMSQQLAAKDIEISRLKDQYIEQDNRLQTMAESNNDLQVELEKLLRDRIQTHQNSVELRMQGLDFKAEVDRRSGNILTSVQARMGFVPVGIEKQVELLRALKAPGDPSYDQVRQFRSMKIPITVDAESYVSGLGSGSDVSMSGKGGKPPVKHSPTNYSANRYSRPSPNGRKSSESLRIDDGLAEDWELSPTSPIRSNCSNSAGAPSPSPNGQAPGSKERSLSAPARRSPREKTPSPMAFVIPQVRLDDDYEELVASPVVASGGSPLQTAGGKKFISGAGASAAVGADSANIVRKLRSRNLDSRDSSGKSSPVSGTVISFNTLNGGQVAKSGSPVRGAIEASRLSFSKATIGDIPQTNDAKIDEGYIASRERRSSSGATSTGISTSSLY